MDVLWGQPIKLIQVVSLLQNFMNIDGTPFFKIFWFPRVSAGPQKPQTLTALKTKYEKFGPKF